MKPKVLLTRHLPAAVMDRLRAETELTADPDDRPWSRDALIAALPGHDALLCTLADRIDAELMDAAAGLRIVANFAVGVNNIDLAAAAERAILVSNTPDVLTDATADIAFGLLLAAARRFSAGERLVRSGTWAGWEPLQLLGGDVAGSTLGLVGLGRIGRAVARRARGFDMRLLYWNRTPLDPTREAELGLTRMDLPDLLAAADHVSLHCAYTPDTHHLIDAAALARMKPTASLINTARGAVVDEAALVDVLSNGRLAAAGLDVYEREPALHPGLAALPNVVLLPHLGSATLGVRTRMGMMCLDNILAATTGHEPPQRVR